MGLINLRELLKAGGQAAGVIGAGAAGYGEDQAAAVKEAIQQAQMARQARQDAIENSVKLAGINPDIQRALSGAKAAGETEGATPGLVNRENLLNPVKARGAAMQAEALIPVDVKKIQAETPARAAQAAATATATEPVEVKKAVDIATQTPQSATGTVLPGSEGNPPQLVVTGGKDPNHPLGSKIAIPGVEKSAGAGAANAPQMAAAKANFQSAIKTMDDYEAKLARGEASYGPFDATKGALGSAEQAQTGKGIFAPIESFVANQAGASLRGDNPELAEYLKAKKFLAEAALNTHKRPNQTQYEIEQELSGIGPMSDFTTPQAAKLIAQSKERRARFGQEVFGIGAPDAATPVGKKTVVVNGKTFIIP